MSKSMRCVSGSRHGNLRIIVLETTGSTSSQCCATWKAHGPQQPKKSMNRLKATDISLMRNLGSTYKKKFALPLMPEGKIILRTFSFLPTTIMEIINGTIPVFAQWNYRISCHPLSCDVPLNRFRMVDEFHSRLPVRRKYEEQTNTRAARFQLNPRDHDIWDERFAPYFTLLDKLMGEIPGKDNYQGNLTDEAFDLPAYTIDPEKSGKVNAAYYHRAFKVQARGAMGQSRRYRGCADQNLFVAMTTQPRVAGMKLNTCKGPKRSPICKTVTQKPLIRDSVGNNLSDTPEQMEPF